MNLRWGSRHPIAAPVPERPDAAFRSLTAFLLTSYSGSASRACCRRTAGDGVSQVPARCAVCLGPELRPLHDPRLLVGILDLCMPQHGVADRSGATRRRPQEPQADVIHVAGGGHDGAAPHLPLLRALPPP